MAGGCCCPSQCLSEENTRLCLLAAFLLLYMLCGAIAFSALERDSELQAHHRWEQRLANFSLRHGVDPQALRALLRQYEEAYGAGVRVDPLCPRWDFPGAFYFASSVIATIGFGMTAPATTGAKIFLIFYGLFGCAAAILLFNLFLERFVTQLTYIMSWCHRRQLISSGKVGWMGQRGSGVGKEDALAVWKPSVGSVTLILGVAALLVACSASTLYSTMEGWGYFESLYFCFVAFSTIGFGDLVSSQKQQHETQWAYRLGSSLLILMGICCLYSLCNIISILIKQALNWIQHKLGCSCTGLSCCRGNHPHNAPRSQSNGLHHSPNAVHRTPPIAPSGGHQRPGASVETVCSSENDMSSGHQLSGETISVRDFLASNRASMAVIQKQLSEVASGAPKQTHTHHIGFSEPLGTLAVMNNRLQETSIDR